MHEATSTEVVLLRPDEAARRLGLTVRTLELYRRRGDGPGFVRLNARTVRYPLDALEEWVEKRSAATVRGPDAA
jgi:predicted DNA-binding transcriptional regulator AlpA